MSKKKHTPAPKFQAEKVTLASESTEPLLAEVSATTHIMAEGENILTVAGRYLPEGMTRSEYATKLVKSNGSFAVGRVINLG